MKKNFLIPIGLMLFALFFGAGNLIFPVYMGQNAGVNTIPATLGFLLTGVGFRRRSDRLCGERPRVTGLPCPQGLRHFLHRLPLSHHRAGFRHPSYSDDILCDRHRALLR